MLNTKWPELDLRSAGRNGNVQRRNVRTISTISTTSWRETGGKTDESEGAEGDKRRKRENHILTATGRSSIQTEKKPRYCVGTVRFAAGCD